MSVGNLPETFLTEQLIKVGNNLVEQTQTLDTFVIALEFHVELGEIWYAGKQDADGIALLVIKILPSSQMYQIQLNTKRESWNERRGESEKRVPKSVFQLL